MLIRSLIIQAYIIHFDGTYRYWTCSNSWCFCVRIKVYPILLPYSRKFWDSSFLNPAIFHVLVWKFRILTLSKSCCNKRARCEYSCLLYQSIKIFITLCRCLGIIYRIRHLEILLSTFSIAVVGACWHKTVISDHPT